MPVFNNIMAGAAAQSSGDLGETIEQSLRFEQSRKCCLTKTLSSSQGSNRRTWTFSTWVKKAPHGSNYRIFTGGNTSGGSTFTSFMLESNNKIRFYSYNGSSVIHNYVSSKQFRDASAWYHFVVAYDTTNTTAADRIKIYVNGERITDWETQNNPSPDYESYINKAGDELNVGTYIGGTANANNDNHIEGYLAETVFIDGSQLAVTEFGRTNEDGVWVNKTYDGSYSGNSFRLVYDSSAGLGDDSSGLGNDFTANNFETTAISSSNFDNDSDYQDTPNNNVAILNPGVRSYNTLSDGLLTWDQSTSGDQYFSVASIRMDQPTYGEMVALENTNSTYPSWGVCNEAKAINVYQGNGPGSGAGIATDTNSVHCLRNGGKYAKGVHSTSGNLGGPTWSAGDIVRWTFNPDNGECRTAVNGGDFFTWHTLTSSEVDTEGYKYFCAAACNTSGAVNFGNRPFVYSVPTGFTSLQGNNFPEPTIKNGKEYFDIARWVGNNDQNRDITGLAFQPDFVWIKRKDGNNNANIYDCLRGVKKHLTPSYNYAMQTTDNSLTAFNSDGFEVGTGASDNTLDFNMVAWCWKAGGTPTATNTENAGDQQTANSVMVDGVANDGTTGGFAQGTIAVNKMSVNTESGFGMIQWTGTGANGSLPHGLGKAPELVFYKQYNTANDWVVTMDVPLAANNEYMHLNAPNAKTNATSTYTNGDHTSTLLNIGSYSAVNADGGDMIVYYWTSIDGFSKIGSYEGNSNADGVYIYTGFKPQYLLIKRMTANDHWAIYDSSRDTHNPCTRQLYGDLPNSSSNGAESNNSVNSIDFLANGFKMRTSDSRVNAGSHYLYMAFAEHPFIGENTPPATAR